MKVKISALISAILLTASLLVSCRTGKGNSTASTEDTNDVAPAVFYSNADLLTFVRTGSRDMKLYNSKKPPEHLPYTGFAAGEFLNIEKILPGQTELIGHLNNIQLTHKNKTVFYNSDISEFCIDIHNTENDAAMTVRASYPEMSFAEAIKTGLGNHGEKDFQYVSRSVGGKDIYYRFLYLDNELKVIEFKTKIRRFIISISCPVTAAGENGEFVVGITCSPLLTALFSDGDDRDSVVKAMISAVETEIPPVREADRTKGGDDTNTPETD